MTKHLETLAIHAGKKNDPTTGAVAPPIYLSTTYERLADGSFRQPFNYTAAATPTGSNSRPVWLPSRVALRRPPSPPGRPPPTRSSVRFGPATMRWCLGSCTTASASCSRRCSSLGAWS